jgi:gas vesicle protein
MGDSRFLEGVVVGAIIGAGAALLFAPQTGEETRTWLKKMKDDNQDVLDKAKETSEGMIANTKAAINEGIERLSAAIEEKKKTPRKRVEKNEE